MKQEKTGMNFEMIEYYERRAKDYQDVYNKTENKYELSRVSDYLSCELENLAVLELACGTGYWTDKVSIFAKSILAFDINDSAIRIAKSINHPKNNVSFFLADIFNIPLGKNNVDSIFGCFIWSHIPLQNVDSFLKNTNNLVPRGGKVIFIDNSTVNQSIDCKDKEGNTYQIRYLKDGRHFKIIKNFPTEEYFAKMLAGIGRIVNYERVDRIWILMYETL